MYQHCIEASILFENGEKDRAIELLESFVESNPPRYDELVQAHEYLLRFKQELNIDTTSQIGFLSQCDVEDLFGDSLLSIGMCYKQQGNMKKAMEYFLLFRDRTDDPIQFAEISGYGEEWEEVNKLLPWKDSSTNTGLYSKCEFGEKMDALTESERTFILCEYFVESVNSGGFVEYFSSAFSRFCKETVDLLRLMGSKDYTKALDRAINLFPNDFDFSNEQNIESYIDEHEKIQVNFETIEEKIYDSNEDIEFLLQPLKEKTNDK